MDFYRIVIAVALSALVLILAWFAYTVAYSKKTATWPPVSATCPDGWTRSGDDASAVCTSTGPNQGVGKANDTNIAGVHEYTSTGTVYKVYPNAAGWATVKTGLSAHCAQRNWANANQIQWNGVSNANDC